jgi:hypothetical protein
VLVEVLSATAAVVDDAREVAGVAFLAIATAGAFN